MSQHNINVIGVGYIGSVISLYLAERDYKVTGIDKNKDVTQKEKWFDKYNDISSNAEQKHIDRIKTSTDYQDLKEGVSVVCVNTPEAQNSIDLTHIKGALTSLAEQIEKGHTIILRSTLPPGRTESELIPLIEKKSGLAYGEEFNLCYAPEFVRGGKGLEDLKRPSKVVFSGNEGGKEAFKQIFPVSDNAYETSIATAEALKCFDNVFHGLKISLSNESGRLGEEIGFDPKKVMEIISSDLKLNISDMYMNPGAPYGGPCISKDIGILDNEADRHDVETSLISSINESNNEHGSWIIEKIEEKEPGLVGLIGGTYKEGFNSAVNSPGLSVASKLRERGFSSVIYEPDLSIEGFEQTDLEGVMEADIWIIFNQMSSVEKVRSDFKGDIIDLSDFNF